MLATQYMMENRDHSLNISLDQLVSLTLYLVHRSSPKEPLPFAITDLLLFWGWWTLKDMERPEVRQLDEAFYVKYLQFLVFISASSPLPEIRNIAYTLCGRLLYLQHESVSFAFIADTIADCPFENAQVAMVGILKRLMIPDEISDQLSKLRILMCRPERESNTRRPPRPPSRQLPSMWILSRVFVTLHWNRRTRTW